MFASLLHLALLVLLFLIMGVGGMVTVAGAYTATVYKGDTRAAGTLDLLCWLLALLGLIIFVLAATHFVPLALR